MIRSAAALALALACSGEAAAASKNVQSPQPAPPVLPAPPAAVTVTLTFPAPAKSRAVMTVNPEDVNGAAVTFKVKVGSVIHTFTKTTPAESRTVEVPADPRTFIRFTAQKDAAAPTEAMALILPDSRPLLSSDPCATWDLASSGGSATATCVARERHCPTYTRAIADGKLTENQCGSRSAKFCVPDYQIDVSGEAGRKVRVSVDGEPGKWLPLFKGGKVRHMRLPSGGRCSGITVESGTDRVFIAVAPGQQLQIHLGATGGISAEDLPPSKSSRQAAVSAD
jgi:hypothetical protein